MTNFLLSKLTRKIRSLLRSFLQKRSQNNSPTWIKAYNEYSIVKPRKKALLSYLVYPLLPPPDKRDKVVFSNLGIAQHIPKILNELGYEVDIINYDDISWSSVEEYDLFVGHGGINFSSIAEKLSQKTVCVYFSTGIYWREFNIREAERLLTLAIRQGFLLTPDRRIKFSEEEANQLADGIICLGNKNAAATYSKFPNVITVNNAVYPIGDYSLDTKDFDSSRRHFFFFSGPGCIHKGLDRLIEAFAQTDLHLHVCQRMDAEFTKIYENVITNAPNIHIHGEIPMRSRQYEDLVSKCNWTILATCAEGQPGATLECMGYGLIPILPETANIDLMDFGILLSDCEINTIRATIHQASQLPPAECKQRAIQTMKVTKTLYTPERFDQEFKSAIQQIVLSRTKKREN